MKDNKKTTSKAIRRVAAERKEKDIRNDIIDYISKYQDDSLIEAFANRNLQWFGVKDKLYEFSFNIINDGFSVIITSKETREFIKFNSKMFCTMCRMAMYKRGELKTTEDGEVKEALQYAKYEGYGYGSDWTGEDTSR